MNTFYLKVIASDKVFFEGRCLAVNLPASDGGRSILANHENMIIAVVDGVVEITTQENEKVLAVVSTGLTQVVNNRVTVLVDTAERPEDIDVLRAREAQERAEEQIRQKQSIKEYHHTQASLARAMSRLKAASRYKH